MAYYKSAISFGLVHIPVELKPAIKDNDTSFNMLHKKCGSRVKYQKFCPICHEEVKHNDLIKGYEYTDDKYVTFDDDDFEKIKSDEDKEIEIISFVNLKEIDPIYFEKSYILTTKKANKAFSLFKAALKKQGKVAIAKTVLGNKSFYVILRFGSNNIILSTLRYQEELQFVKDKDEQSFTKKEMDLALKLIDNMSDKFEPEKYKDDYQDKIKEAIEKKINGEEIKKVKTKKKESISSLMEALEKSINGEKK